MTLSVVIPWSNRPVLGEALAGNAGFLRKSGIEVIVVNGGGARRQLERLAVDHGWPRIRIVHIPSRAAFNKSECLNLGVSLARGRTIFVLDADVILTRGFIDRAIRTLREDAPCFVSVAKVIESAPEMQAERWNPESAIRQRVEKTTLTAASGRVATFEYRSTRDGTRTGPGLVVAGRRHFIAVQGFNSNLKGWGFEDYDFQVRLQLSLGLKRKTFGRVLHLSHSRVALPEGGARNKAACLRNYNQGLFLGTYDADVRRLKDRAIEVLV